jgi:hypothetical protein
MIERSKFQVDFELDIDIMRKLIMLAGLTSSAE